MDDFEYSVEISERDWDCFFAECEDCNLLPPSLAGVDDSGMSDFDDKASIFGKKGQKVHPTAERTHQPVNGPPNCEESPIDHCRSGMESILSGSEEDIHLQSVNMFFERLKNVTEAERGTEPKQMATRKNRDAKQDKCCNAKPQAIRSTLLKNIPTLNSLPVRAETAVDKETMESVDTISKLNTMTEHKTGSRISFEPAASSRLVVNTNTSAHPEMELFIREEACTETRVNEAAQRNQSPDSPDRVVGSETAPDTDRGIKVEMCTHLDYVGREELLTSPFIFSNKGNTDPFSFPELVTNFKWKEDQNLNVLHSDATYPKKAAGQELSPCASLKRKRRKKRRLSVESAESLYGYERSVFVRQSDSDEEHYAWRRRSLCMSEDINLSNLNKPQKYVGASLPASSAVVKPRVKITPEEIKVNDSHLSCESDSLYKYQPESSVRRGRCEAAGSDESNATNDKSVAQLSQIDDGKISTQNNIGNTATVLQPSAKLQIEDSTVLNKYPGLPLSATVELTGKIDLDSVKANFGRIDDPARSPNDSDNLNHSVIHCENKQNPCTVEVKSTNGCVSPSTKSNDNTVEVSQNDKLSAAKTVLAVESGNPGTDNHILCQREAELQQQLEVDCRYTDQYSSTVENSHFPLTATGESCCDAHDPKTRHCPFLQEFSSQDDVAKLTVDTSNNVLPDEHCLCKGPPKQPLMPHTLSAFDERAELEASPILACHTGNRFLSGEINLMGKNQRDTKSSMSADIPASPSDVSSVTSCCPLDNKCVMSNLNETLTDMSNYSSLVNQIDCGGHGGKTSLVVAKPEGGDSTSGPKNHSSASDTVDSTCDLVVKAEDAITTSKTECELVKAPDSKQSVFAISSFWNEMEKLTINDILGLRMINKAAPSTSLPPLQESEEIHMFAKSDSGFFTQIEPLPEQINEDKSCNPDVVDSKSSSVIAASSCPTRGAVWEREAVHVNPDADIYQESMVLTSVSELSQPVLPGSVQTCLRKMSKNVSVHNLPALESESFNYTWKGQTLQTLDEGQLEKVECFTDGHMSKQEPNMDCSASSSNGSFRISLTDVFQYLFGGKNSIPNQSATENTTPCSVDGNSVPETYDHFFSEFDTETFFYPLTPAKDRVKDELVPIFSCSRSANRNLEFPEAYDHFFASSSSDESSDEEEDSGPVRVFSRFNRTLSKSKLFRDSYDNFFTDSDIEQDFFWKNMFSFRNMNLTGSAVQEPTLSKPLSLVPVRQSGRGLQRAVSPLNALGNQDAMVPDPLLYHLDERISRQLAQKPFRYEDLEMAVSNPRLDAPLLPLKQSDMCLVCIAFASWVLKTANPQVGDAWKAVLLANVSALSAIGYLRKHAKMEVKAAEKKLPHNALCNS